MVIRYNAEAAIAQRNYARTAVLAQASTMRLSSGYRINSAADDPAGLAISEKMRAQIRGINVASRNCSDQISKYQTAEGNLQTVHDIMQRMNELSVQAASDTNESLDRKALDAEYQELLKELADIGGVASFNDQKLFDGSGRDHVVQSGPNEGDVMSTALPVMADIISSLAGTDVSTRESAGSAIERVKESINKTSTARADIGAKIRRLEHRISYLDNASENLTNAESRIRDVDMAKEMAFYAKTQIILQAGLAVMAQANQRPQQVLQLLQF